jgi:hypothetical protein
MISGRSRRLSPPPDDTASEEPATVPAPARTRQHQRIPPALASIRSRATGLPDDALGPERLPTLLAAPTTTPFPSVAQGQIASPEHERMRHRRWLRLAPRVLILPALLFIVLVPPQSLRATLITLLIIAALGVVVWRLPMADDE